MIRRILVILILSLLITSCGGAAPAPTEAPLVTEAPTITEEPTESFVGEITTPTAEATSTPAPTKTAAPTNTPAPTRTDTPLPPLELPTEVVSAPARMVWDGTPTYPGDSTPGYSFRVTYAPDVWALTTDQFGFPALGHRNIPYCVISVTSGRGLPPTLTVEHDILNTGNVTFDVSTALENGVKKFVTYTGGDGNIITAFEVSFQDESDACLADAVTVLTTLRSVPNSQATPAP
ncbi:MAG: hypothetical protein ABI621_02815 [Chloroflexota bacterium]